MLLRSTLSMSDTMLVTTAWSNSAGRAIWRQTNTENSHSGVQLGVELLSTRSTCARCKKEVCLFREDTKWRAMGSFLAARHSGRFSSDEANQRSQCLAKLRMSAKRLMENIQTLNGSFVNSAQLIIPVAHFSLYTYCVVH